MKFLIVWELMRVLFYFLFLIFVVHTQDLKAVIYMWLLSHVMVSSSSDDCMFSLSCWRKRLEISIQ